MTCRRGSLVSASDGQLARCVGPWSKDKLYYVGHYLSLFSRAMRRQFPVRHLVDLFAGPGFCVVDNTGEEIAGSPFVGLNLPVRFTRYHFVEKGSEARAALEARLRSAGLGAPLVTVHSLDANKAVSALRSDIAANSLSVAFVDPTGLHFSFDSLTRLTQGLRMDLIYVFPEGMAAKRNLSRFLKQPISKLDVVLGTRAWRGAISNASLAVKDRSGEEEDWESIGRPIVDMFITQLRTIGYRDARAGADLVSIKNRRNVSLYYIVFASKNPLGQKFWQAISRYDPSGQGRFDY